MQWRFPVFEIRNEHTRALGPGRAKGVIDTGVAEGKSAAVDVDVEGEGGGGGFWNEYADLEGGAAGVGFCYRWGHVEGWEDGTQEFEIE